MNEDTTVLCAWSDCDRPEYGEHGLRLCVPHAMRVYAQVEDIARERLDDLGELELTGRRTRGVSRPVPQKRNRRVGKFVGDDTHVYFVQLGNVIKIGYSADVIRRMANLPCERVLAVVVGDRSTERAQHHRFSHLRVSGEWFAAEPELLAHIHALAVDRRVLDELNRMIIEGRRDRGRSSKTA